MSKTLTFAAVRRMAEQYHCRIETDDVGRVVISFRKSRLTGTLYHGEKFSHIQIHSHVDARGARTPVRSKTSMRELFEDLIGTHRYTVVVNGVERHFQIEAMTHDLFPRDLDVFVAIRRHAPSASWFDAQRSAILDEDERDHVLAAVQSEEPPEVILDWLCDRFGWDISVPEEVANG